MMELKEPKSKTLKFKLEPKSSLPLVFGNKGELTKFHANLTALGSCVADPVETQMIYKMGYFGKGSLSKSHPSFGRIQHGAPPVTRKRQWQRRQEWINEVQKLSNQTFCENNKNDANLPLRGGCVGLNSQKNAAELERAAESCCNTSTVATLSSAAAATSWTKNRQQDSSAAREIEILNCDVNVRSNNDGPGVEQQQQQQQQQINKTDAEIEHVVCLDSTEEEEEEEEVAGKEDASDASSSSSLFDNPESSCHNKDADYFFDEHYDNVLNAVSSSNEYNRDDSSTLTSQQVLVLSDSDSESENYLINIKPEIKYESFPVRETLHLTAEETFFLMYALGCLRLMDFDGKYLSIGQTWQYFCKEQSSFLQKYVTYHYFRSKGWVVKPGLNYGGDYLLYKEGPPFYHSSYIVIIDVLDATTLKRIEAKSVRNMTWNNFIGLQRLAETVRKEVLVAQVLWPSSLVPVDATASTVPTSPEVLSQFTIREILVRRWKTHCLNAFQDEQQYSDNDQDSNYSS